MITKVILAGLIALLFVVACEAEPEPTPDVVLLTTGNPFAIERKLTQEQASGDADVIVSYPAVTHLAKDGPAARVPGRVIGWLKNQVEVIYPGQGGDDYIKVFVSYGEDFDPADLHDDKDNLASCRFSQPSGWPIFKDCKKVN